MCVLNQLMVESKTLLSYEFIKRWPPQSHTVRCILVLMVLMPSLASIVDHVQYIKREKLYVGWHPQRGTCPTEVLHLTNVSISRHWTITIGPLSHVCIHNVTKWHWNCPAFRPSVFVYLKHSSAGSMLSWLSISSAFVILWLPISSSLSQLMHHWRWNAVACTLGKPPGAEWYNIP